MEEGEGAGLQFHLATEHLAVVGKQVVIPFSFTYGLIRGLRCVWWVFVATKASGSIQEPLKVAFGYLGLALSLSLFWFSTTLLRSKVWFDLHDDREKQDQN